MITVSNAFKEAVKAPVKIVRAYLDDGDVHITESDDLQSLKMVQSGQLCKAVMRQAEAVFFGAYNFLDKYVNIGVGVMLPAFTAKGNFTVTVASPALLTLNSHGLVTGSRVKLATTGALPTGLTAGTYYYVINVSTNTFRLASTYANALNSVAINTSGTQSGTHSLSYYPEGSFTDPEYIDYGQFKVVKQESNKGTDGVTVKMFDRMYDALIKYDLTPTYPITLTNFLQAICTRLGWTLGTTTFPNSDLVINSELFSNQNLTYREILDKVAEAAGSIMYFNTSNQLVLRQISATVVDALDKNTLNTLKVESQYGPVYSVVLSRQPQEDNIAKIAAQPGDWWNNSWLKRVKITVSASKVPSNLTNFPVYVNLADMPAGFHSVVAANGADIRVVTPLGVECAREIAYYDGANGELHFLAPSLSSSVNTEFYIYYDNSAATDYAADHMYGSKAVWANYKAVLHGNMSGNQIANSVNPAAPAFRTVQLLTGNQVTENTSGKVNKSISFPGRTQIVNQLNGTTALPVGKSTSYRRFAQSFVAPASGVISGYTFRKLASSGTFTGTLYIAIYQDSSGVPGTSIFSQSIGATDWNNLANSDKTWAIGVNPFPTQQLQLTPGATYWLGIEKQSGIDDTNYANVAYDPTGSYGVLKQYNGSTWTTVTGTLRFDLSYSDDVQLGEAILTPPQSLALQAWVKKNNTNFQSLFLGSKWSNQARFDISGGASSGMAFESFTNNLWQKTWNAQPTVNIQDGNWHQITLVSDATNMRCYIDATLVYTSSDANQDSVNQRWLWLGAYNQFAPFAYGDVLQGEMDEVRISQVVPTANQLTAEYNNQGDRLNFYTIATEESK